MQRHNFEPLHIPFQGNGDCGLWKSFVFQLTIKNTVADSLPHNGIFQFFLILPHFIYSEKVVVFYENFISIWDYPHKILHFQAFWHKNYYFESQNTIYGILSLTFAISCVTMILYLSFVLSLYRVSGYYLQYTCSLSWKIVSL